MYTCQLVFVGPIQVAKPIGYGRMQENLEVKAVVKSGLRNAFQVVNRRHSITK
jgi:hypothetical protein